MFSGIVKGTGRIIEVSAVDGDRRIGVDIEGAGIEPPAVGASIAVNGVCLTATATADDRFDADISAETLAVTTLTALAPGARVNLEPSLRLGDPLDGHLLAGHVDGVGRVVGLEPDARSLRIKVELPPGLARYVARKGSIAVDGVSLTVNGVEGDRFDVNVVPHTREATVIGRYAVGTEVNVEVDLLARYVERALSGGETGAPGSPGARRKGL